MGVVADPGLAALTSDGDAARRAAPDAGRRQAGAQRHTADGSVHTHAGVLAAGLEALAVVVDDTVILAACADHVWKTHHTRAAHSWLVHSHICKWNILYIPTHICTHKNTHCLL